MKFKLKAIACIAAIVTVIAMVEFAPASDVTPYAPIAVIALLASLGVAPSVKMGAVVAEAYVEHFDRNFSEIKDEMYEQFPKQYTIYIKVDETSKAFVKKSYMGGLGIPLPNRDLEPIPFQEPVKGPISFFTPTNYRLGYQIEKQTIEQEEFGL